MKKQINEKFVTNTVFLKKMGWVENEFKNVRDEIKGVKEQVEKVALHSIKVEERVQRIKENMATKQDVSLIIGKIDSFINKSKEIDQEQLVQGLHIKELRETTQHHEARIASLELSKPR